MHLAHEYFITKIFSRGGVVSASPNPQAGGPPLVGCPRLLIRFIRRYPPYRRPFLHPQPEDAPCRGDRDPLVTASQLLAYVIVVEDKKIYKVRTLYAYINAVIKSDVFLLLQVGICPARVLHVLLLLAVSNCYEALIASWFCSQFYCLPVSVLHICIVAYIFVYCVPALRGRWQWHMSRCGGKWSCCLRGVNVKPRKGLRIWVRTVTDGEVCMYRQSLSTSFLHRL